MSTSQSQICSSSLRSCDDTSTVRPVPAKAADQRAHLAHALRVEPVGGLVEDQQLGVAEQRGGDAEALLHAERVGAVAVVAARRPGRRVRAARGSRSSRGRRRRRTSAGSRRPRATGRRPGSRSARRRAAGTRRDRSSGEPSTLPAAGASGERGRAASPSWWSCRRRSGRRTRRRRPSEGRGRAGRRRCGRRSAWSVR